MNKSDYKDQRVNDDKKRHYKELSPIQNVIKTILQEASFQKVVTLKNVAKTWKETIGKETAKQSDVSDFKNGVLYIDVNNPIISMEIGFKSKEHIKMMNSILGKDTIHSIIFRTKTVR